MSTAVELELRRDPFGRLIYRAADGSLHEGVVPVRAFPIADPQHGIALVSAEGAELAWFDRLDDLPGEVRRLIEEELASREFMPEIRRIVGVTSYATPCTWTVETDRGETSFVLKGEEDIRRLADHMLLIADTNGIQFLIRDILGLDRGSRRVLDRFL